MKNSYLKYFLFFLIILIVYFASFQEAKAGFFDDVVDVVSSLFDAAASAITLAANVAATVINVAITAINITTNFTLGTMEVVSGKVLGLGMDNFLSADGTCRLDSLAKTYFDVYVGKCGSGSSSSGGSGVIIATKNIDCSYEIPITFYDNVQTCTTDQSVYNPTTGLYETVTLGDPSPSGRKVAIYRFDLPAGGDLTNWFINLGSRVGGGILNSDATYHTSDTDEKFLEVDYDKICSSGVCNFTDYSAPDDSYVAYTMKILGDGYGIYDKVSGFSPGEYTKTCNTTTYGNKFLNKNKSIGSPSSWGGVPGPYLDYSTSNDEYDFAGPYKTGACVPSVDLKTASYYEISKPNDTADVVLSWNTANVSACTASGDWSGSKAISSGKETLSEPRGNYDFILSCSNKKGKIVRSRVTPQVIEVPKCSFSAASSTIVLPQTTSLSWNCDYASYCSIVQDDGSLRSVKNIGSVSNNSGSLSVRPNQNTTYVLFCTGLDGERSFSTSVSVGSPSKIRYKEVVPR